MKTLITNLGAAVVLGLLAVSPSTVFGQTENTTTTTTSTGTVSELAPDAIAVREGPSPTPVRYTFTKTTSYVDENGNPVSVETVRTGVPVTVYYEKNGDSFIADKVVVKKSVTTIGATTPAATVSQLPGPPTTDGIIKDADSDDILIQTASSARPVHYQAQDATAYVDERGNPVSRKMLAPGTPVTIFYEQNGDDMLATRVVVKNSVPIER